MLIDTETVIYCPCCDNYFDIQGEVEVIEGIKFGHTSNPHATHPPEIPCIEGAEIKSQTQHAIFCKCGERITKKEIAKTLEKRAKEVACKGNDDFDEKDLRFLGFKRPKHLL